MVADFILKLWKDPKITKVSLIFLHQNEISENHMHLCNGFTLEGQESNCSSDPWLALSTRNHMNLLRVLEQEPDSCLGHCHLQIIWSMLCFTERNWYGLVISHVRLLNLLFVMLVEEPDVFSNWAYVLDMGCQLKFLDFLWPIPKRRFQEHLTMSLEVIIVSVSADIEKYFVVLLFGELWLITLECNSFQRIKYILISNNKTSNIANFLSFFNSDQEVGIQGSLLVLWVY